MNFKFLSLLSLMAVSLLLWSHSAVGQESDQQDSESDPEVVENDTNSSEQDNKENKQESADFFDPTEDISEDYAVPFPTDI